MDNRKKKEKNCFSQVVFRLLKICFKQTDYFIASFFVISREQTDKFDGSNLSIFVTALNLRTIYSSIFGSYFCQTIFSKFSSQTATYFSYRLLDLLIYSSHKMFLLYFEIFKQLFFIRVYIRMSSNESDLDLVSSLTLNWLLYLCSVCFFTILELNGYLFFFI